MKKSILTFAAIALAVSVTSCDEEFALGGEGGIEQQLSEQFLKAESIGIDVYNILDIVRRDTNFSTSDSVKFDGADVFTYADGSNTVIAVNYGTGVIGADGKTRKGAIIGLEVGDYTTNGGAIGVSFQNYEVDNVKVAGTVGMNNTGSDNIGLSFTEFKIDDTFTLNAAQDLKWVSGFSTGDQADDKYELAGTITGKQGELNNEITITIAATDALSYDRACQYGMVSGVALLALSGDSVSFESGVIDFIAVDGCNNNVDLTISSSEGQTLNFIKQFDSF